MFDLWVTDMYDLTISKKNTCWILQILTEPRNVNLTTILHKTLASLPLTSVRSTWILLGDHIRYKALRDPRPTFFRCWKITGLWRLIGLRLSAYRATAVNNKNDEWWCHTPLILELSVNDTLSKNNSVFVSWIGLTFKKSIVFWDVTPWVATEQTTRRHITEDDTLHNHRCENLKSYNF
jgi:hypothetical protein